MKILTIMNSVISILLLILKISNCVFNNNQES